FELDGWTLEHALSEADHELQHLSVKHACPPHMDGRELIVPKVHVYLDGDTYCWRCTMPIPEGIVALYVLHEWDKT
ncbi:hypothetical protein LCGC14_2423020, partial [marine sediment metagenome]